eukprot:Pgem_evm1s10612
MYIQSPSHIIIPRSRNIEISHYFTTIHPEAHVFTKLFILPIPTLTYFTFTVIFSGAIPQLTYLLKHIPFTTISNHSRFQL